MVMYAILAACLALPLYAYVGYPILLWIAARRWRSLRRPLPAHWPTLSISVPMHNEAGQAADLLDSLLAIDYPHDRLQILVVSDASTDGTDEIVRGYASRGVEFLRLPERRGKTAAENAARSHLTGEIVLNTDASIRIPPASVKKLVAWFDDPTVGLASGRDVSVSMGGDRNMGEAGYVSYEMAVRDLETAAGGIVGASGCFYAVRARLHDEMVPEAMSRDFAAAMIAREHGYRAVSVSDAVCWVPRTTDLKPEYRRKVRTMTRGMETLFFKRHLLNPRRYGSFAWKLFSHKVCRWLVPWAAALGTLTLLAAAPFRPDAAVGAVLSLLTIAPGVVAWLWPDQRSMPRLVSVPAYVVMGNLAALHAAVNAVRGELNPIWEPTRRERTAIS